MMHEIIPKIKDKQVILIGEIHGTKEIPELLSNFFRNISKTESFNLCLEIPDEFQGQLNSYMNSGDDSILKNMLFFSTKYCRDGRNSLEYLNLVKTIYEINLKYNKNIKIFCVFPSLAKNQEEVERGIADNILEVADNKKIFAILGNIHASKREVNISQNKVVPAGFLIYQKLKDKIYSILFKAKSGEFFNNGLRKVVYLENELFDANFDYVYKLDKVSSCSFL